MTLCSCFSYKDRILTTNQDAVQLLQVPKPGLGLQSCEFHFPHDQLYCNAMQNQLHSCMHFSNISDPYYLGQQSCSESLIEYP